jgi:hypothetical protein
MQRTTDFLEYILQAAVLREIFAFALLREV